MSTITTPNYYLLCPLRKINDHIWSLLPVVSTGRPQWPHLITTTSCVHWKTTIATADHYYQLCPLRDHNHHIRSLLPVVFSLRAHNHHIWSLLPVVSTGRPQSAHQITATSLFSTDSPQSPHLTTTTSCVHWETTITTSAHCYQLCPLGDHNYHCWLLLPVVSTGRKQSPHQITATSFFHWEPTITTSDHCYQLCPLEDHTPHSRSLLPVLFTESPKLPHLITATRFFSTGRQQSQHTITTTSCVHWEHTITTSDHYYQLCPLGDHNHHIRSLLPVFSTESPHSPRHIWSILPVVSTEKAQSPHLITTTNFVHLLNVLTNIRSIQIVLSTKIIKSLHSIRQLVCQPRELNRQTNYLLA